MKKRLVCIFLLVFALFNSISATAATKSAKKKNAPIKHKIEFTTRDKFILVGDLYMPQTPTSKPLVVCLHSYSMNSLVWTNLAQALRNKGYNVLAMDLRGHGRSVYNEDLKLKSRFYFKTEVWQRLPKDVIESINYVKQNYPRVNTNQVIIVGSDVGASAGVIAALTMREVPKKMVLISPMLEFKGLGMPVRTPKFYDTKIMILIPKTDRIMINFYTKTPMTIKQYQSGGPGNQLLKVNPDSINEIVNFIIN